jgi:hypothetical protein
MSKIGKATIPIGSEALPRHITDPESGVTATVSGSLSTGVAYKYRLVLISFNDLGNVVGFPLDTAVELIESLQEQIDLLRKRAH